MEGLSITPVSKSSQIENWSLQCCSGLTAPSSINTIDGAAPVPISMTRWSPASESTLNKIILKMEEARKKTSKRTSSFHSRSSTSDTSCSSSTMDCSLVSSSIQHTAFNKQHFTSSKQLFARLHLNRNGNLPVLFSDGATSADKNGEYCENSQNYDLYSNKTRRISIDSKISKNKNGTFPRRASRENRRGSNENEFNKTPKSGNIGFKPMKNIDESRKDSDKNRLNTRLAPANMLTSSSLESSIQVIKHVTCTVVLLLYCCCTVVVLLLYCSARV